MKAKILLSLILMIGCYCINAQSYIRIKEDVEMNGIKLFKGEVYPKSDNDQIKYLDTVLKLDSKYKEIISDTVLHLVSGKSYHTGIQYQIKSGDIINKNDTITLIDPFSKPALSLVYKDSILSIFSDKRIGYRLIIPQHQTLVFGNIGLESFNDNDKGKKLANLKSWHIIVLFLAAILLTAVATWLIIKEKIFSKKYPIFIKYGGGNFVDFATENRIKKTKLFRNNKNLLKPYLKIKESREKEQFKKNLIGKDLIIGYSKDAPTSFSTQLLSTDDQDVKVKQGLYPGVNSDLVRLLNSIESNILKRLNSVSTDTEAQKKAVSLQKDIDQHIEKLNQSESIRKKLIEEVDNLKEEFNLIKQDKLHFQEESSRYREKVVFVDFLYPYAKVVLEFLTLSQTGFNKALELYKRLSEEDERSSMVAAQLLLKFLSQIPYNIGNWEEIIREITESRTTSNIDIIKSLKQIQSNEEKLNEFKRLLTREILEKYSSGILILFEELTKLSRFTNTKGSVIREFENFYIDFSNRIQSQIKTIGLEISYIPLFENYLNYAGHTKLTKQACSNSYKNVKGLEKDTILEIVSYGFGGEETKVILF